MDFFVCVDALIVILTLLFTCSWSRMQSSFTGSTTILNQAPASTLFFRILVFLFEITGWR